MERKLIASRPITNPVIENTYGGAVITYDIPKDNDVCFIRAEYMRNGILCTDHSSVYKNSITVEGFGTTDPVEVYLYTVDSDYRLLSATAYSLL